MGILQVFSNIFMAAKGGSIVANSIPIIESITGRICNDEDRKWLMGASEAMGKFDLNKYDYAFWYLHSFYLSTGSMGRKEPWQASSNELKMKIMSLAKQHISSGDIACEWVAEKYGPS